MNTKVPVEDTWNAPPPESNALLLLRFQCSKSTDNPKIYVSSAARHVRIAGITGGVTPGLAPLGLLTRQLESMAHVAIAADLDTADNCSGGSVRSQSITMRSGQTGSTPCSLRAAHARGLTGIPGVPVGSSR